MFPALPSYSGNLTRFAVRVPNWRRTATTPAMGAVCFSDLGSRDLAHGVVEGQAEDLGTEVDGVAGQIALGPTPTGVFDDQTISLPSSCSHGGLQPDREHVIDAALAAKLNSSLRSLMSSVFRASALRSCFQRSQASNAARTRPIFAFECFIYHPFVKKV